MKRSFKLRATIITTACVMCACSAIGLTGAQRTQKEFDTLREAVTTQIVEPDRRARALAAVDGLQDAIDAFSRRVTDFQSEMRRLNANPNTQTAVFQEAFDRFNSERDLLRRRVVAAHLVLLTEVGPQSWPQVADQEKRALLAGAAERATDK